jgi:hypothetical protein
MTFSSQIDRALLGGVSASAMTGAAPVSGAVPATSEATSETQSQPQSTPPLHQESLLTSVELARALKVNDRLPEVWRQNGTGPPYMRVGGRRILYRWADALAWLNDRRFSSTSQESRAT